MKPTSLSTGRVLTAVFVLALAAGLVSWDNTRKNRQYRQSYHDTVPDKEKTKKIRDLDDVIDELDRADMSMDMQKVKIQLDEAMKQMKELNLEKIKAEMDAAMKMVDMDKIRKQVEESMASLDTRKMKEELDKAMSQLDQEKIRMQVKESLDKVEWEKIKEEMEKVKGPDMQKMQAELKKAMEELEKIQPELKETMAKAKEAMEKAKAEMKEYKGFVDGLDKDGLINKKEDYRITHKNGVLEINGKKVSAEVYNKYRSFLEKHKSFNINKSADDFDMDRD